MKRLSTFLPTINIKKKKMQTASKREWIKLPIEEGGLQIRVVNYNVLAPSLLSKLNYKCPPECLKWEYRLPIIIKYLPQQRVRRSQRRCIANSRV